MANKIVPIRGEFHTPSALLASVMDDETVESLVMVTIHKDGQASQLSCNMKASTMAWASLIIGKWAVDEERKS